MRIKYRQATEGVESLGYVRLGYERASAECPGRDQETRKYLQGVLTALVDGK